MKKEQKIYDYDVSGWVIAIIIIMIVIMIYMCLFIKRNSEIIEEIYEKRLEMEIPSI